MRKKKGRASMFLRTKNHQSTYGYEGNDEILNIIDAVLPRAFRIQL